jgi:hypothetical protein
MEEEDLLLSENNFLLEEEDVCFFFFFWQNGNPTHPTPPNPNPNHQKNKNESKTWDEKLSRLVWSKRINCLKQFRWSFPPWVRRVGFFVLVGWASEIN